MQAYRAARVCQEATTSTYVYFALLMAVLVAAMWLARDAWSPPEGGHHDRPRDAAAPVVVLCIGVTLAMRLIEVCAGGR